MLKANLEMIDAIDDFIGEIETINFMKELSGNSTSYSTSLNYCKADVDVMLNYMRGENNGREGTDC